MVSAEYVENIFGLSNRRSGVYKTLVKRLSYKFRTFVIQAIDSGQIYKYNSNSYRILSKMLVDVGEPAMVVEPDLMVDGLE